MFIFMQLLDAMSPDKKTQLLRVSIYPSEKGMAWKRVKVCRQNKVRGIVFHALMF